MATRMYHDNEGPVSIWTADHNPADDNYDVPFDETAELTEALRLSAEATHEQMKALQEAIRRFVGPVASDPCQF